ncbi:MAG: hypothetical protein QOJ70_3465 [Acidobacteriota bacterium]|jgi:hypothetical protein|nr:hypothetical protein [Acidobacteriota bacterium]
MSSTLSPEQVTRYEREGFVFPVSVLTPAEAATFRVGFETLEARLGGRPAHTQLVQPHLCYRWAYDLATHPQVLDAVEAVVGPNILVHSSSIFPKYPGRPERICWHQDAYYWGLNLPRLTSAWIALSDSTVENGCMRAVPGTHLRGVAPHHQTSTTGDNRITLEVSVEVDEARAVDVVLRETEMSLHHPYLVHGSNANRSTGKRLGFAVRYVAPEVRQSLPHHAVVLARGFDDFNHFTPLSQPPADDLEAGIAAQAELARWAQKIRLG